MNKDDDRTESFVPLTKGVRVGHYTIIEKLGAGGMGEVYLAEDTKLKRQVALKFLPYQFLSDENAKARFTREAQAAAKLNHPNIVTVHEVSEYRGRPFFAMECCDGRPLRDIIKEKELSIDEAVNLAIQICEGLDKAHNAGIVHRDIKPSNIVIDSDGRAKLLDFGLATVKGTEKLTQTGSTLGTIGYMSPEQIEVKETDQRSDLFSLGVVLYEMIAGRLPFKGDADAATLNSILNDTPEPLSRYKSNVPEQLQQIISKLLEKNVSYRYQSAAGVLSDLRRLSSKSLQPTKRIDKWNWYVVPAALVILLAIFVVWRFGFQKQQSAKETDKKVMLAVLPFKNLGDPNDEYFADGITEEIMAKLSSIKNLGVISSTSSFSYKGTKKTLPQIARELKVGYILEGNIRWDKKGETERVRITPQLIKVDDDIHIWSENYDEELTNVFSVQSQIAGQIAGVLNIQLTATEQSQVNNIPTENMEAYDYFLRARQYLWGIGREGNFEIAIEFYQKAVELDSNFILAITELSWAHSYSYWDGFDQSPNRLIKAKQTADLALSSDSEDSYSHIALGYYYYYGLVDYKNAEREFEIALKDRPNNMYIIMSLGFIKRRLGQWEESFNLQKQAYEIDPLNSGNLNSLLATARFMRRFEDVDTITNNVLKIFPDNISVYEQRADLYFSHEGDPKKAIEFLDDAPESIKPYLKGLYAEMKFCAGEYEEALSGAEYWLDNATDAADTANYYMRKALYLEALDRKNEAQSLLNMARQILEPIYNSDKPIGGRLLPDLSEIYAKLGDFDAAINLAKQEVKRIPLEKDALLGARVLTRLANVYILAGEFDKGIDLLDTLLQIPSDLTVSLLKLDCDPLCDYPRFQALIKKYEKRHGI